MVALGLLSTVAVVLPFNNDIMLFALLGVPIFWPIFRLAADLELWLACR